MGYSDHPSYPTMYNFSVDNVRVKGVNYVGGIAGYIYMSNIDNINVAALIAYVFDHELNM